MRPPSTLHFSAFVLLGCLLFLVGCRSAPAGNDDAGRPRNQASASAESPAERDEAVRAVIEASAAWQRPSCRWLKHGAWVVAYPSESKLYHAARDMGFIELEEVGQANRHGVPEPAYRVKLTEAGAEESARCDAVSQRDSWGIPVSERKLLSVAYKKEGAYPSGLTLFEVEFEWQPTDVGEMVKYDLTGTQAVQEGRDDMLVNMRRERNGWRLDALLPRVDRPPR